MIFHDDTVLVFSPLPPKENGIADYVAEQLPFHARHFSVVVVIDNADPEPVDLPQGVCVLRMAEYQRLQPELTRFPHVYHVGNNPDHGYLLPVLYSVPGLVVVHDLGLHHLIDNQTLVKGKHHAYAWALWQKYGLVGKLLGKQFLELGWKGQLMPQELMLNGAIIDAAQHIVVHSRYSADRIVSEHPAKPVSVIPHHLSPAMRNYNRARRPEQRKALGLPAKGTLITSLGFINHAKQIVAVLEALAQLKAEGMDFHYVLAGKCRREEYDVYADIERFGLQDRVHVTGYLDEHAFFQHLVAADLVVNLRYPSGGETSGTMTRALGMGRCCVVVDVGPFAELPSRCAVKLPWSGNFADTLRDSLRELINSPSRRAAYEIASRDWISQTHTIQRTTDAYHQIFRTLKPQKLPSRLLGWAGTRVAEFSDRTSIEMLMCQQTDVLRQAIASGAGQLWWREGLIPRADGASLHLVADEPEPMARVLQLLLDYKEQELQTISQYDLMAQPLAPDDYRIWPRALACLSQRDVAEDPVAWLAALNWRLQPGGELVLWLLNSALPAGALSQTPKAWVDYLEAAGFEVLAQHESPSEITFSGLVLSHVEPTFRARKLSERVERAPQPWYEGFASRHLLLPTLRGSIPRCEQVNAQPIADEVCHG